MTVKTKLPTQGEVPGEPATGASRQHPRARASGRVELGRGARLTLTSVPLDAIRGLHPALRDRDARLDLASGSPLDLTFWTPESLDIMLSAAPPWVLERHQAATSHFLVVAGGQLFPALRRTLPPSAMIPVMVVDAKFTNRRWLQIAAMHAAAIAGLAAGLPSTYVHEVLKDAEVASTELLTDRQADPLRALHLPPRRLKGRLT